MKENLMRKQLIRELPMLFVQSIETGTTALGIPDLFFFDRETKRVGWIELKQIDDFAEPVKVPFRPGQYNWLRSYVQMGGTAYLICTSKSTDEFWYVFAGPNIKLSYAEITECDWCGPKPVYSMLVQ